MGLSEGQIKRLIDGCRKNDRQCQRELYEWMYGYAVSVCKRYASAFTQVDDLVLDGMMRIFKNIKMFDSSQFALTSASFKGWAKRILINNCINYNKKFEGYPYQSEINDDTNDENEMGFVATPLSSLSYKEIIQMVMKLPPAYKTVFCLHVIDGYTHQEIAGILGINEGTSKSNLSKARKHLQNLLNRKQGLNG